MKLILALILFTFAFSSCKSYEASRVNIASEKVDNEGNSSKPLKNFGYTPIDPMPIDVYDYQGNFIPENKDYLVGMPDETILVATGKYDDNGSITFGPMSGTVKGEKYVVILDWIKYNTISQDIVETTDSLTQIKFIDWDSPEVLNQSDKSWIKETNSIPIYVGVGLRLKATFEADSEGININGIFGMTAGINSSNIKGNLIIQSMGISGKSVNLPLPSDINPTSIQNAMMAISSIRALVYTSENDDLQITPRIIGYYNTLGEKTNINKMVSALSQNNSDMFFRFKFPLEKEIDLYENLLSLEKRKRELDNKYKTLDIKKID